MSYCGPQGTSDFRLQTSEFGPQNSDLELPKLNVLTTLPVYSHSYVRTVPVLAIASSCISSPSYASINVKPGGGGGGGGDPGHMWSI